MENNMNQCSFREYDRRKAAVFKKTTEKWGELSNMAAGFPVSVNGITIRSCEALYQACRFPDHPEVQRKILDQTSPMTAKMVGKPHRVNTRRDWDSSRIQIMKWCIRVKLIQNWKRFSFILLETGDLDIVEDSSKDDFWGAKPKDKNILIGTNALGRLLMQLREQIKLCESPVQIVPSPNLPEFLLLGEIIKEAKSEDAVTVVGNQSSIFDV